MRLVSMLVLAHCLGGCVPAPLVLTNPITGATATVDVPAFTQRRADIEGYVTENYADLIVDITAGFGRTLAKALQIANVPRADRAARVLQMQGNRVLYANSPAALINDLLLFGR